VRAGPRSKRWNGPETAAAKPAAAPAPPMPWCTCDGCGLQREHADIEGAVSVSVEPVAEGRVCAICGKSLGRGADVKAWSKWCRRALARWR
jgi:hypothetical protein